MRIIFGTLAFVLLCVVLYLCANFASDSGAKTLEQLHTDGEYSGVTADKIEEIAALLPTDISEQGHLTAASQTGYAPNEFISSDHKTYIGFELELFRLICGVLGVEPVINYADFDTIIPQVGSAYDLGVSGFSLGRERADTVDFLTVYAGGETFAVAQDNPSGIGNPIDDKMALCGRNVGVQTGTAQDEQLGDYSADCVDAGQDGINIYRWVEEAGAYIALLGGKVDVVFADEAVNDYAIKSIAQLQSGRITAFDGAQYRIPQGMIFNKSNPELTDACHKAMQYLVESGKYQAVMEYWNVAAGAISEPKVVNSSEDEIFDEYEFDDN